jgi:LAO/AO transport system kinase
MLQTSQQLVQRARSGNIAAIGRLMSRAEVGAAECRPALADIYRLAGRAHVIGITGVPGSGKSTLATRLAVCLRQSGRRIGIVAIDPSSPFSGGAILGDRIRMQELAGDPGVFIRSMATRGALGGLARGTLEAVDILDAAGYDTILIETVGVGQDEVDIVRAAHTVVVVSAPGLGDDIQAIKAGVLEIADIHAVSKCDRPDANKTIADLKNMLTLVHAAPEAWRPPVVPTSSHQREEGIDALLEAITQHHVWLQQGGRLAARRRNIVAQRLLKAAESLIRDRFDAQRGAHTEGLIDSVAARDIDPFSGAIALLKTLQIEVS